MGASHTAGKVANELGAWDFCSVPAVKSLGIDFSLYLREVGGVGLGARVQFFITQFIDSPYVRYTKTNKL